MELVPAGTITDEDLYVQYFLECHPAVKYRITRLLNSYRNLTLLSFEAVEQGERDTADGWKSLAKKDSEAGRLDIPLWEGTQEWAEARDQYTTTIQAVAQEEGAKLRSLLTFQEEMQQEAISQIGTIEDEELEEEGVE